jgi:uridine kinase
MSNSIAHIHHAKPFVIGITGGSASGKTLFLKSLLKHFSKEEVSLISQDNYYRNLESIPKDHNGIPNFDLPECIDFDLYSSHIRDLVEGKTVVHHEYTFNQPGVIPDEIVHYSTPVIVVEGLFVFYEKTIADQLDLKIFVDAKEKIKIDRRLKRDIAERGISEDEVMYQWLNHVKPTYENFIKPTRKIADIVINNNDHFENGLWMVTTFIKSLLGR